MYLHSFNCVESAEKHTSSKGKYPINAEDVRQSTHSKFVGFLLALIGGLKILSFGSGSESHDA